MSQIPFDETNRNFLCENLSNNESNIRIDNSMDMSSLIYLENQQRKLDHRRNKSEPLIISNINLESSSTSTDSNQSFEQNKRKSTKIYFNSSFDQSKQQEKSSLVSSSSSSSTTTKKRKSWYNPFQSTYRQRHEEFKKFFSNLPTDERLIVDYSCAWQKEILIQGRMYISQNYLCFYANFLKWETSLMLKLSEIQMITREKTAKVIPNAMEIKTNKNEKYFFASFATRDKTYARIFQIWQTILNNQSLNSEQIWNLIHQSYGNDLDMTTDEEDNCHQNFNESKLSEKEDIEDRSSYSSQIDEDSSNLFLQKQQQIFSQEMTYLTKCPCQNHLSTQLIDRTYSLSVDDLFDCIFNNKHFLDAYHRSRRIKNFQSNEWKLNEQSGQKERLCTYNVNVSAVFGETTISSNEKQIIDCELANSHYIIDTEVRNEGIKYADNFFIASRYCLIQIAPNKSHLKLTCEVRYIKSVMMIIKSFIEKNAMAALQDSFTDLSKLRSIFFQNRIAFAFLFKDNRLESWSTSIKHDDDQQRSSIIENPNEKLVRKRSTKKHQSFEKEHSSKNNNSIDNIQTHRQIPSSSSSKQWSFIQFLLPFCLFILLILLCVNIFLFIKLNSINQMTDYLIENSPIWLNNDKNSANNENNWSILLKTQEEYYQDQLRNLQEILLSTHSALKNVTDSLYQLTKVTKQSNRNTI